MPAKLERCVADVKAKGVPRKDGLGSAWAICVAALKRKKKKGSKGKKKKSNPLLKVFQRERKK